MKYMYIVKFITKYIARQKRSQLASQGMSGAGAWVSENDWGRGAIMLNLCVVIPFLPYNAIDLMLKFDIIGGPRATPKLYKLKPMVGRLTVIQEWERI